ncbi:hypothetical protein JL722_12603 [Aureococcus anophagefferens]|nr:hypothetical protein JL722_12603 [Aureococcus anophagefferens]
MVQTRSQRAKLAGDGDGPATSGAEAPGNARATKPKPAERIPQIPTDMALLLAVLIFISVRTFLASRGDASAGAMTVALASRGATVGFEALAAARCASFVIAHRLYLLTWTLQGIYFALAAAAAVAGARGLEAPPWLPLKATRYLFEVAWAVSHLVTSVTTYVLVPAACEKFDGDVRDLPLLQADQLVLHNVNCILMHVDTLLSGQYLAYDHAGAALLYACYYVSFAWTRSRYVAGGVPALPDYCRAGLAFKLHLGLAGVVVLFFYLGVFVTTQLGEIAVPARCLVHVLIVGAIVRFRPPPEYRARAKAD